MKLFSFKKYKDIPIYASNSKEDISKIGCYNLYFITIFGHVFSFPGKDRLNVR